MTGLRFEVIPEEVDDAGRDEGGDGGASGSPSLADRLLRVFPVPSDVTLTVTSLPQHGVERTLRTAVSLAGLGFRVVPHLPARGIADRRALDELVGRMLGAGISEVFTVSGDAVPGAGAGAGAGAYTSSLELIRDLAELDAGLSIGIAGYPEGHPHFSDEHLQQHLLERAPYIDTIVTQLCYSAEAVARYAMRLREAGVDAAFWVGVPGAVRLARLEVLSERLGVGASRELLQAGGIGSVGSSVGAGGDTGSSGGSAGSAGFDSAGFVRDVQAQPEFQHGTAGATLAGAHVYTFNEIESLPAFVRAVTVNHA